MCLSLFSFEASKRSAVLASPPHPSQPTAAQDRSLPAPQSDDALSVRIAKSSLLKPIVPSEGCEKWAKEQVTIVENTLTGEGTPRLIDGATFLSPSTERLLKKYVGQRSAGLAFKEIDEGGYKFAFVFDSGEKWFVSEPPYYKDQFPTGLTLSMLALQVCKAGAEHQIEREFPAHVGLSFKDGWINFSAIREIFRIAEESRLSEQEDKAGAQRFDLVKRPIGYIALVDWNPKDPIFDGGIEHAKYFGQLLSSLKTPDGAPRYTLLSLQDSDAFKVQANPREVLRGFVRAMHTEGIRDFYLRLSGHGNEKGVWFTTPGGYLPLSPGDLHAVFTEFKDSSFVVDATACFGGGIAPQMRDYRDPSGKAGRIVIKLQAKASASNQEGRLLGEEGRDGCPKVHSSYYDIFHVYFLIQGHPICKAHYLADEACKRVIRCDAEMWVSGPKGGIKTATLPDSLWDGLVISSPRPER
jgi:hypothetical protein